jgi:hypothetical protein
MIIYPYDLNNITTDALLVDNNIISVNDTNFAWYNTILPKSFYQDKEFLNYSKDRIVTLIDDSIFTDFNITLLNEYNQTIIVNNKRKYIKSKEIGDYTNSIKRYTQLNKSISYNEDAQKFLNLPKNEITQKAQLNVMGDFNYGQQLKTSEHPHITHQKKIPQEYKYNNKTYIVETLKWAVENDIKYIYSINEYRPYILNTSYVTPYIYYTITGSK